MGRRNVKGLVSIEQDKNRIRLRWRYGSKRYSLNLSYFNVINLRQAKKVAVQIEHDLAVNEFDFTLLKYKPQRKPPAPRMLSIAQQFEEWVRNYRNKDCAAHIDYWAARNMIKRWGVISVNTVVKKLNAEKINERTYNKRLSLLRSFYAWLVKQKLESANPFEDVSPRKIIKRSNPKRKPFTPDEIGKILFAIKNDTFVSKSSRYRHSHYYPFLYFIFKTGVRNAEAIGLRKCHIDLKSSRIDIIEVLARTMKGTNSSARVRKETKNGKSRALPLTDDLLDIFTPLLKNKNAEDLVFTSPTGKAIDDRMFQRRIFRSVLKALDIEERNLYACRHTFGSRCIEAGLTPVMTAFLMGNNPETALRNYVHQLSLPADLPPI